LTCVRGAAAGNRDSLFPVRQGAIAVPKKSRETAKSPIQLIPSIGWREVQVSRLSQFEAHKLADILQEAEATSGQKDFNVDAILNLRRRNDRQLEQLLQELHVDPADPDAWQKAFFLLAAIHHGVGGLSMTRKRQKNKNAAKWTPEQDLIFYQMMQVLLLDGRSERDAVRTIATEKARWEKFPNGGQNRPSSTSDEPSKREKAFRARWIKIIKLAPPPGTLMRALVGDYPVRGTEAQQDSWITASLNAIPDLVKIKAR
jgi:hypothetical protein